MTFFEIIKQLRGGKGYRFGHPNLDGHFYKAPFPSKAEHTTRDGAHSAITFWNDNKRASPTLMLYDFDEDADWWIKPSDSPEDSNALSHHRPCHCLSRPVSPRDLPHRNRPDGV